MTIKELKEKDFSAFTSKGNVVVDFWAEWCGPCKMMEPHFKKVAEKATSVKFAKVNVDEEYELANQFEVMSIPTTIFFKDGEMVDRHTGAMNAEMIEKKTKEAFA